MADSQSIKTITGREILLLGGEGVSPQSLDPEFSKNLEAACKQLSQLIAWMWLDDNFLKELLEKLDTEKLDIALRDLGIEDINKVDVEVRNLKKLFDAILKYQAFNNDEWGNKAIAEILIGENQATVDTLEQDDNGKKPPKKRHKIVGKLDEGYIIPETPSLTLQKVYEKLVPPSSYNKYVFDEDFTNDYYAKVAIDTYDGTVFYDFFGTNNPTQKSKFIVIIPYPPKPQLSNFTVTKEELETWAKNKGDEPKDYNPPNFNPFIPINGSSC